MELNSYKLTQGRNRAAAREGEIIETEPRYKTGVFAKYVALVGSASEGAVTAC